jgi:hypothetical protein
MNDKDLAKALLHLGALDLPAAPSAHEQILKVLSRDRRRVRILAGVVGFFWLGSVMVFYGALAQLISLIYHIRGAGTEMVDPLVSAVYKFLLVLSASIEALILALLGTVVLVFASRRASLRQINATLIDISQKLNRLEKRGDPGHSEGSSPAR